ncbi:MAG: acyltransferase [Prolixibacteraceae bacterium]|nr:acyltransferase [Prolixibacteraceae bacterium]
MIKKISFIIELYLADCYKKAKVYQKYLGVKFGKDVRITGKINFGSEPFLISVGNHVTLAHNVTFHTHDGGIWIFREEFPQINIYGPINIGNNVFIGSNVIILPNVKIGDNVVIGAGSVVTKSLESNCIYAGNPAKMIKTVAQYKEKAIQNAIHVDSSNMQFASIIIKEELKKFSN